MTDHKHDDRADIFKTPQLYKGIKFYPLKIIDYIYVDKLYRLLGYPKTYFSIRNPVIYKMSYLKFLMLTIQVSDPYFENVSMEQELADFLMYVTKAENVSFDVVGNLDNINTFDYKIIIDGVSFSAGEFDEIRKLILKQSGLSVEYVEAFDEKLEESLKFLHKNQPTYSFKDKVFAFAALLRKTIDEIKDCTLYEMENILESTGSIVTFNMHTIPLTEVKEDYKLPPYIAHLDEKSRYSEILVNTDNFKKEADYFKDPKNLAKKKK